MSDLSLKHVDLEEMQKSLAAARSELLQIKYALQARRTKFSPDQPRVPSGQREGGQWTVSGGSAGSGSSGNTRRVDVSTSPVSTSADTSRPDIRLVASRKIVTLDYSRALTGISTIDDATKALSETLTQTLERVDFIPEWAPRVYGTAVHVDFAAQVRSQAIRGISPSDVEQSFFEQKPAEYGDSGSVRTDVVLRDEIGDVIAIYDVKTGGAVLTAARVRELRYHTNVGPEVPIIELQVNRGATIKGRIVRRHIGVVMALLWNPMHRGK